MGVFVIVCLREWTGHNILLSLSARAFYSALSRIVWGLALAYITVSCYYGYGGNFSILISKLSSQRFS